MATLFIDADSCPVLREAIDCARKERVACVIAGNTTQNLERHIRPDDPRVPSATGGFWVRVLSVGIGADSADFAIARALQPHDVLVTQDIGLASIALGRGAAAIGVRGRVYSAATIDSQLFIRHEEKKARRAGKRTSGPAPFTSDDRKRFRANLRQLLGDMPRERIRLAHEDDVDQILDLYDDAHEVMRESGNETQWPAGYPNEDTVREDMERGSLYVCAEEERVLAVFFCAPGPDPTYAHIDGAWASDAPYNVVHRIAARAGTGAGRRCIAWACGRGRDVRIDTHEDNAPMRSVLQRLGFEECGVIICDDGTPRVAYQHLR